MKLKRPLNWDVEKERFVNDDQANAMLPGRNARRTAPLRLAARADSMLRTFIPAAIMCAGLALPKTMRPNQRPPRDFA